MLGMKYTTPTTARNVRVVTRYWQNATYSLSKQNCLLECVTQQINIAWISSNWTFIQFIIHAYTCRSFRGAAPFIIHNVRWPGTDKRHQRSTCIITAMFKHIPTVISFKHWDGAGHWSPLSSMTRTRLSRAYMHVVSIMAPDGLPTRNVDFGICDKISFQVNEEKIWMIELQNVDFGMYENIFLQKINEKFGTKLIFVENDVI